MARVKSIIKQKPVITTDFDEDEIVMLRGLLQIEINNNNKLGIATSPTALALRSLFEGIEV